MKLLNKTFKNKKVLILGHTGFKGSWLTYWLKSYGAKIVGFSLDIPSKPSHFEAIKIKKNIINKKIDIKNLGSLKKAFKKYNPDFVFHLAAQALVKKSYLDPVNTWMTNSIGTINVLECLRSANKKCIAVIITSDKCYQNLEIKRGYKEEDVLGGKDPYSASKAAAEIAIKSYISSYFPIKKTKVLIGIARAGNVVGGGDWSVDRLIPDSVKSWSKNKKVLIRSPNSTRPWQHVLEALWGYLLLAAELKKNKKLHGEAFNFGPATKKNYNVIEVLKKMKENWSKVSWKLIKKKNFYESNLLKLNSKKANKKLGWQTILTFDETIKMISEWYKVYYSSKKNLAAQMTLKQIKYYEILLKKRTKII